MPTATATVARLSLKRTLWAGRAQCIASRNAAGSAPSPPAPAPMLAGVRPSGTASAEAYDSAAAGSSTASTTAVRTSRRGRDLEDAERGDMADLPLLRRVV